MALQTENEKNPVELNPDNGNVQNSSDHSLARDSVGTTLTNIALFFLGIVIWIAVARILDPIWRGALALVMISPAIVMKAGTLGFDYGIVVIGGADRKRLGTLTRTGAVFGLISGMIFIGVLMGFMWGIPKVFWKITQVWLPLPFEFIAIVFPIHLMTMALDAAIYAEDRIATRNAKEFLVNFAMLVTLMILFFGFQYKLFGVIGSHLIANVISLVASWWLIKDRISLSGELNFGYIRDAIRLGFPIYLANLASFLMLPAMMVLLSVVLPGEPSENLANVAFFTMGYQMVDRILPVTRSVAYALLPKITSGTDEAASELTGKASRHTLLISFLIFAALLIFLKPLVAILLGKRYLPIVLSFAVMAPGGVALSVGGVWSAHLLARHHPYKVATAGITGVAVALIAAGFGFWLFKGNEVVVASTAVVIGGFTNTALLLKSFSSIAGVSVKNALIPDNGDIREWRRIPGLISGFIQRRTAGGKTN